MQICYICLKIPWNFTPLEVNQFILDDFIILWNDPWTQLPNTCIYTFVVKSKCTSIFLIFSESKADRTCSSYRISLTYSTFSKRKRINKASKWIRLRTNKGFTLSKDAWQSQQKHLWAKSLDNGFQRRKNITCWADLCRLRYKCLNLFLICSWYV